ncbi:MAG: putative toxin-antitoxin system toxin component, PIN family [Rickettsiales bacterium]|nr:putative toxin-antitoxin system toxin component, PIN family [Pseudomonadota bacterium]MDA0965620.1 putative toxin-antitoxin system toxin component, PIN family [Pseudomonadota bacterium]MDG4542944.1 putative toxin-antitoxin system toxin component, PIN family [Rickettsiales bacterium]MDG4544608.1 putative toxin-antitoxin system toxin component, PIN family [Rickettsiales bacterium]MDG4546730.1 putative toxin-antitoxin system toxin component, PIN family [Rickettsiales bacterium]
MRFVCDTNVIISALMIGTSSPARALQEAEKMGSVLYSTDVLEEISTVLSRPKFSKYIDEEDITGFLARIHRSWHKIAVNCVITDCRDSKDNKFLEVAVSGDADIIISGDQDLLTLHPYRNINILTPADFLNTK